MVRYTRGSSSGARRRWLGRGGELLALVWLTVTGHRLLDRNWRCSAGELDLVVERSGEVVFVEVKTRSSAAFGGAVAAVDRRKQERMVRAAEIYCSTHDLNDRPCRFDVMAIQRSARFPWLRIERIRDAFPGDGRRVL